MMFLLGNSWMYNLELLDVIGKSRAFYGKHLVIMMNSSVFYCTQSDYMLYHGEQQGVSRLTVGCILFCNICVIVYPQDIH